MRLPPNSQRGSSHNSPAESAASQGVSVAAGGCLVIGASGRIGRLLRAHVKADPPAQIPDRHKEKRSQEYWRWQKRPAAGPSASESEDSVGEGCAGEGGASDGGLRALQAATDAGWWVLDPLHDSLALQQAAQGMSAVLCLAGPVPGRGGSGTGSQDMRLHSTLALAAVEAAASAAERDPGTLPAHVFLASSAAVYGAAVAASAAGLSEDQPLAPQTSYGEAKAEMEQQATARAAALGVPLTLLRIGNIAGLDACLGGWRPGFTLDHFADGRSPQRSYIGAECLAQILSWLVAQPAIQTTAAQTAGSQTAGSQIPKVLNIAQPGGVEMGALLQAAGLPYGRRPAPAQAIAEVVLDVRRLMGLLAGTSAAAALPQSHPTTLVAEARRHNLLLSNEGPHA